MAKRSLAYTSIAETSKKIRNDKCSRFSPNRSNVWEPISGDVWTSCDRVDSSRSIVIVSSASEKMIRVYSSSTPKISSAVSIGNGLLTC